MKRGKAKVIPSFVADESLFSFPFSFIGNQPENKTTDEEYYGRHNISHGTLVKHDSANHAERGDTHDYPTQGIKKNAQNPITYC